MSRTGILWLLLSYQYIVTQCADTFTSLVHLHQSIQAERDIVTHINTYIDTELNRLEQIKGWVHVKLA